MSEPRKQYEKGKLYRIYDYPWPQFTLYTVHGVLDPNKWSGRARKSLLGMSCKDAVFLYLGYIPPDGNTIDLYHVICQDMVGVVDARMTLERLEEEQ